MADPNSHLSAAQRQSRRIALTSHWPLGALSFGYLVMVHDVGGVEAVTLAFVLGSAAVLAGLVASAMCRRGSSLPDRRTMGDEKAAADRDVPRVYQRIVSIPVDAQRITFISGLGGIGLVPVVLWLVGFDAWIGLDRLRSLAAVGVVFSLFGSVLAFHRAKRAVAESGAALADDLGESSGPMPALHRSSLHAKLVLTIGGCVFAALLLFADAAGVKLRSAAADQATDWAATAIRVLAEADPDLPLSVRIARELPHEALWPVPVEFVESDIDRDDSARKSLSKDFLSMLDREREAGHRQGSIDPSVGVELGAYRVFEDGRLLVATLRRADLGGAFGVLDWTLGFVGLGLLGLALVVARSTAREITIGLARLEAAATKLASGNFADGIGFASDDELGELGGALASLRTFLRSTIARVALAAEGADQAVEGANSALGEVDATGASQVELLQHVHQMMAMINARVDEASHSATELTTTIDESGSSLLELGATGEELNQTAATLTSKVDAVSESLEQMVGSVKQIAGTTEKLSSASEETSASMEEMASSMRAVDISAEATANLSREVVEKAELGQAKVVQTIAGMEAIREATDVAESVIRGLGARTSEIGGILDVIDDVADETNLLALNAAIIAAQAGEHGKAFSVVADEIKELADRVLASTKEIGGLIRAVQDESENAIGAIEAGSASVMSGVDLSAEAGRTLEEITIASRESGTRIADIVSSVREQTNAASHVVQLMERVRESAEEIGLAGNEQDQGNEIVYQTAQAMREVAQQVRRTTEEQARSFGRIRENVVGVREAVGHITGSLGDQSGACRQVAESLMQVSQGTRSNEDAAKKMREAIRVLAKQAESLREDVGRFRV